MDSKITPRMLIGGLLWSLIFILLFFYAGAGYAMLLVALFFLPQAWRPSRKAFNRIFGGVEYAKLVETEMKPLQALGFVLGGFTFVAAAAAIFFPSYFQVFVILVGSLWAGSMAVAVLSWRKSSTK